MHKGGMREEEVSTMFATVCFDKVCCTEKMCH